MSSYVNLSSMPTKPAMTAQQAKFTSSSDGALKTYIQLAVGNQSFLHWLYYEFCILLFSNLSGVIGLGLRRIFYPALFSKCGKRPALGKGVVIRCPKKISIADKVIVDDYATLDVRGTEGEISIADHVSLGRGSSLVAKEGSIVLEQGVNIGSQCRIATQSKVTVGESTLIAAYTYIGPGNHQIGDEETPTISRDMEIKDGVTIGKNVWIGTRATILDGVSIGEGSVVGAHSLVRENVPANTIVAGVPAKVVKKIN